MEIAPASWPTRCSLSNVNTSAATKVQLGFSLAALCVMTIGLAEMVIHCALLRPHPELLCGGAGAIGFVMWFGSRLGSKGTSSSENPLTCLAEPSYWGLLLALSALLAYSHSAYRRAQIKPVAKVEQTHAAAPPQVVFPPLKLEGIIFQGARSTALINGKVVSAGEEVGTVDIVAIQPDHVTVVFQGQTNVLHLSGPPKQ